jgi:hydroxypyruvate reductase
MDIRKDAEQIMADSIRAVLPDAAVRRAISGRAFPGRVLMVAVGKAAWQMANTAAQVLGDRLSQGLVITKYEHAMGDIPRTILCEAGHPVPDANSFAAAEKALALTQGLAATDTVLFLLSGGGSALFEKPLVPAGELQDITRQLLACGADIVEMNTIRKRLSAVKGGKFALHCRPARIFAVVLSDIIGDPPGMIASGPAYPDASTAADAWNVVNKYGLRLSPHARDLLALETPKTLDNVETHIAGSVRQLCTAAQRSALALGYAPVVLTDSLCCEAREAGGFFASIAQYHADTEKSLAFIAGGETVVRLKGKGKGGRNQELALAAAPGLEGLGDTALFSIGSDGTDGPTDAAGGYVDGTAAQSLKQAGVNIFDELENNNAYFPLAACGGLIKTGATGTNVNDVTVLLIKRRGDRPADGAR